MKKIEFLEAINGKTIKVSFYNYMNDTHDRSAQAEIEGLPEALKDMHVNMIVANLRAWCADFCTYEDHASLKGWTDEVERLYNLEDQGRLLSDDSDLDDALIWQEWCEQHPTLIFKYVKD